MLKMIIMVVLFAGLLSPISLFANTWITETSLYKSKLKPSDKYCYEVNHKEKQEYKRMNGCRSDSDFNDNPFLDALPVRKYNCKKNNKVMYLVFAGNKARCLKNTKKIVTYMNSTEYLNALAHPELIEKKKAEIKAEEEQKNKKLLSQSKAKKINNQKIYFIIRKSFDKSKLDLKKDSYCKPLTSKTISDIMKKHNLKFTNNKYSKDSQIQVIDEGAAGFTYVLNVKNKQECILKQEEIYRKYFVKKPKVSKKISQKTTANKKESSTIRTRRALCEKVYKGRYFDSGSCSPETQGYLDDMVKVAQLEYEDYDKRWRGKDIKEICKEFHVKSRRYECLFRKGGRKNNFINAGIKFYLKMRKVKIQSQAITDVKLSMANYKKLTPAQRVKKFNKDTGLIVIPKMVRKWEDAKAICQSKGLNIPYSDELIRNKMAIMGYESARAGGLNYYVRSAVNDKIGYQVVLSFKIGDTEVMSRSSYSKLVICKKMSSDEEQKLKEKVALEKIRITKFGASTALGYWQKIVAAKNNSELNDIFEYSTKIDKHFGDYIPKFQYFMRNHQKFIMASLYNNIEYTQERSYNIFMWAMKPNAGQLSSYTRRLQHPSFSSSYGLTNKGLDDFIKRLNSQPLFLALSNRKIEDDGYYRKISGNFMGLDHKEHVVTILLKSIYFRIFIDPPFNLPL